MPLSQLDPIYVALSETLDALANVRQSATGSPPLPLSPPILYLALNFPVESPLTHQARSQRERERERDPAENENGHASLPLSPVARTRTCTDRARALRLPLNADISALPPIGRRRYFSLRDILMLYR